MTKLTYEDQYQSITIEVKKEDQNFADFMESVVLPLCKAVYSEQIVKDWLNAE